MITTIFLIALCFFTCTFMTLFVLHIFVDIHFIDNYIDSITVIFTILIILSSFGAMVGIIVEEFL